MKRIGGRLYLTVQDLTEWLRVSRQTIYNWVDKGLLCERYGWQLLFPYIEARDWIEMYKGYCPPLTK